MAEQRKKTSSILLRRQGKNINLELFSSANWPEQCSRSDLFRVRIDDVWYCPNDKHSFLTYEAVGELVTSLLKSGELMAEEHAPYLPYKSDVKIYLENYPFSLRGNVKVEPYQKSDGRFYVQVWTCGKPQEFCCDDIISCRIRG